MSRPLTVMLVAAEASGDALGAGLALALRRRLRGELRFVGVGGAKMAAAGVDSPFDIAPLSTVGWMDAIKALPRSLRRVRETVALAERKRPDIAVLIDSWGFTLQVAKGLRAALPRLPLVKYVAPQVWASRPGRARTLARTVDHLLAIHAFELPWFERAGLPSTFVGNPVLATDFSQASGARFRNTIGVGAEDEILLILPGSRPREIERLLPPFLEAVRILKASRPRLCVVVPLADTVASDVRMRLANASPAIHLVGSEPSKRDAFKAATVALACSGTVTTELALAGCPMVVAYRVDPLTSFIVKRIATTERFSLLNIAAGEEVVPELMQHQCTGEKLAAVVSARLDDPALRQAQARRQFAALERMGRGVDDPYGRAAEAIIALLRQPRLRPDVPLPSRR